MTTNPEAEAYDDDLRRENKAFAGDLARLVRPYEIVPLSDDDTLAALERQTSIADIRRARRPITDRAVDHMTLTETDGVLRWEFGGGEPPSRRRRGRRRRSGRQIADEFVETFKFEKLPPNRVRQRLIDLDARLTPNQGLREVSPRSGNVLRSNAAPAPAGRILLLIHGTFSNCDTMLEEFRATDEGDAWVGGVLDRIDRGAGGRYDQVLAFNHPTLSTTPVLNALRLADLLGDTQAEIDVVAHSRGGLVARWWREAIDARGVEPGRAVLLGCPLGGTSLAAPAQLKHALDLFTNYARAIKRVAKATGAVLPMIAPITEAIGVLMTIVGSMLRVMSKTPLIDAAVGLVPGLAAQGREGANLEVAELRRRHHGLPGARRDGLIDTTYVVRSNFEPESVGWRFWRVFRKPKERVLDFGADAIFPGENDLVVDAASMQELADRVYTSEDHTLDYGTNAEVHHTNYLQTARTIKFLTDVLPTS